MMVFVKTAAAATGSTAAVVATSMAVLHIPLQSPAGAATVHQQPSTATARQHEPDRSSGPVADQSLGRPVASGPEEAQSGSSGSGSATTDGSGPGEGQTDGSSSQDSSSGGGSQPVTINVGSANVSASVGPDKVSASVSAAGVKASVDVDTKKPLDTRVTIKSDKSKSQVLDTRKVTDKVSNTVKNLNKGGKKD